MKENEQMLLFPPITTFHLALRSPLYSNTRSTFSLHFPPSLFQTETTLVYLKKKKKKISSEQTRNLTLFLPSICWKASAPISPALLPSVLTCSQSSEGEENGWADILGRTHIPLHNRLPFSLFLSNHYSKKPKKNNKKKLNEQELIHGNKN